MWQFFWTHWIFEQLARPECEKIGVLVRQAMEQQYLQSNIERARAVVQDSPNMYSGLTWEDAKEIFEKIRGHYKAIFDTDVFIHSLRGSHRFKAPRLGKLQQLQNITVGIF